MLRYPARARYSKANCTSESEFPLEFVLLAVYLYREASASIAAAKSSDVGKKLGITHVLSVCHEYCPENGTSDTHLQIPVLDTEYEDLLIYLPQTTRFIQDALEGGGRVLVHCVMGVSRSTTVVAAFRESLFQSLLTSRPVTSW
jgi:predicted protein tyrosine phosphatase